MRGNDEFEIRDLNKADHADILRFNQTFESWLSPLDQVGLDTLLGYADYARCVVSKTKNNMRGVLIAYPGEVDNPDHKNLIWLRRHLDRFYYIDRIIIDAGAQGQGIGLKLYRDLQAHVEALGHTHLACEVNIKPNNPGSHNFHLRQGFRAIGDQDYPSLDKAVRYYVKAL